MIDYEAYEVQFQTRAERRQRARPTGKPKHKPPEVAAQLSERFDATAYGFSPSYKSASNDHFEHQWIVDALSSFYYDKLLDDVLRVVKGGKEASVYVCSANPSTGVDLLAAKIYRPRMFRNLKNDAMYREGRGIIGEEGKTIKARDQRVRRAVHQSTRFGQELRIGSWIGHEFETLKLLHEAGADIPQPYACGNNAIVMEYLGDEANPAPTLNHVALEAHEVRPLFERVMRNIELMLMQHRVHADLSAYNILYWDGEIKIIDFPQAVDPRENSHARTLLARDVERVCQYFARAGVRSDPNALARDLWRRYMRGADADT